jgi:hypothetical protein
MAAADIKYTERDNSHLPTGAPAPVQEYITSRNQGAPFRIGHPSEKHP